MMLWLRRRFARERIGLSGHALILVHRERTGELLQRIRTSNQIVDDGLAFLIDRAKGDTFNIANYYGVGTNSTGAAKTQQTLLTEVFRGQITTSRRVWNVSLLTWEWKIACYLTSGQANGNTLQEFGVFASPNTNGLPMLNRLTHTPVTKNTAAVVTYLWTGTWTAL